MLIFFGTIGTIRVTASNRLFVGTEVPATGKGRLTLFKRILLPTDGSEHALKAAKIALKFARELNAQVEILSVVAMPEKTIHLLELIPDFNEIKFENQFKKKARIS